MEQPVSNTGRAALFVLLTCVHGPPIGGMLLLLCSFLGPLVFGGPMSWPRGILEIIQTIARIAVLSYLIGLIPALLPALILAIPVWRTGTVGIWLTLGVTALTSLVLVALFFMITSNEATINSLAILALAVVSAVISRWILVILGVLRRTTTPLS